MHKEHINLSQATFPRNHHWECFPISKLPSFFENCDFFWCLAGGFSLDLFAKASWREHGDTDILVFREDSKKLIQWFFERDWVCFVTDPSRNLLMLTHPIDLPLGQNQMWCKPRTSSTWQLEIMFQESSEDKWRFRRDHRIFGTKEEMFIQHLHDGHSLFLLKPEIQLLFKLTSSHVREKDILDTKQVFPLLSNEGQEKLCHWLETVGKKALLSELKLT